MKLCAEVSIYPQKTNNASQIITSAVQTLSQENVDFKVGYVSIMNVSLLICLSYNILLRCIKFIN